VSFSFEDGVYTIEGAPWQISDKPRFAHRGLMIDTARHYESLASIRGIIDSLPYAKLNVLHWHMVDTQSFPFQSKTSPKLWDGAYSESERYTQADVASIVEYARLRGVRVIVEFDMPGHAASWCKGYPEICPSTTCTQPLNVANNATFELIDNLIGELAGDKPLFQDNFVHLGGDEVNTDCWSKTPSVAAWLKARNMSADDLAKLEAIFKKVDADGGGSLDADELKEAFGDEYGGKLMADLDEDGDGELSLEEFTTGAVAKYGDNLSKEIEAMEANCKA